MRDQIEARFSDNLARVENLVSLYEKSRGPGQGRRQVHATDVLRAATVLLHAALEDLVRSIVQWRWPAVAAPQVLDAVPLASLGVDHAQKFLLGALHAHRTQSVQDVITDSITAHLAKSNYGKPVHVMGALSNAGIDAALVTADLKKLGEMMDRRHWIVHRADANPMKGKGQHRAKSISPTMVREWAANVRQLGADLFAQLPA